MKKTKFSELPIEKQRIAVLKDALKLIKAKLLLINPATVFEFATWIEGEYKDEDQLQDVLVQRFKKKQPCTVCERGALLVATVLNDNDFKVCDIELGGTYSPWSKTDRRLLRVFSGEQLSLMEEVLMSSLDSCLRWVPITEYPDYFHFLLAFPEDTGNNNDRTERAIAILENAIAHNGIFTP